MHVKHIVDLHERGRGIRMHIAICDDEAVDLKAMEIALKRYDTSGRFVVSKYMSASALYADAAGVSFDLVILDIEMQAPNGYEIAQKLLEHNPKPLIIFLTNTMAYAIRGYGVAFRYLPKPIDTKQFSEAMDAAVREIQADQFTLNLDGTSHIFRFEEIYYFEVFNHRLILHTLDSEYAFRGSLRDILGELPAGFFGVPHQSYLVNFAHIKTAGATELHLTNGAVVPVSRRKQGEFDRQLHAYLGR